MRFSGQGALRVEPPYKARSDLFGPRGETLMRSVLLGDSLLVPPGFPVSIVPPTALSWATIGVLRQPPGSTLERTSSTNDTLAIGYVRGQERWLFKLVNWRVRYAEWTGPGSGRQTVELRGNAAHGLPTEAIYRDWAAFRELKTTLEQVNESSAFPPETWTLDGP